jgi:hypothetical protein
MCVKVEFHGADGCGGPMYIGTGCFHKRESLCGMKFSGEYRHKWKSENDLFTEGNLQELEQKAKGLASCSYEENTQWGKEVLNTYTTLSLTHTHTPPIIIMLSMVLNRGRDANLDIAICNHYG